MMSQKPLSIGGGNPPLRRQNYDFFLVLDFEATCEQNVKLNPQEIIEFPCLKINGKTMIVESTFHSYVKPRYNHILTSFCEMVNDQPYFEECFEEFKSWLQQEQLLDSNFAFVTCGDWDLKVMFPSQCKVLGLEVPSYMKQWINIKKSFSIATGLPRCEIMPMLQKLKLEHEGRLHSGIDEILERISAGNRCLYALNSNILHKEAKLKIHKTAVRSVQEKLLDSNFVFVTSGDWDLKVMLPSQCKMLGLEVPPYMKKWINIKRVFKSIANINFK
ncbi:hypothetical protein J437_LFUL009271 [Ladona fulva]|uniref:Exonuclease domain-containing protein n=1 Tax=Ladona fulva TaxID=123851 RepID=A0A8K0P424_LADFU|nr:hypothetical protein J437_LFUL009271 [Ladona fulva]